MKKENTSVPEVVKQKKCSRCNQLKDLDADFYICLGKTRAECKKCTISKNQRHQKKIKAWKNRYIDNEKEKTYMSDYYSKNKEKFAEYRRRFKENHPGYYRDYFQDKKNKP